MPYARYAASLYVDRVWMCASSAFLKVMGSVPDGPANLSMAHSALALDIVNIIFSIRDELAFFDVFKLVA